MSKLRFTHSLLAAGALASAVSPLLAASALGQSGPPIGSDSRYNSQGAPPQDYDPRAGSYGQSNQPGSYANGAPMPEPTPPSDYDGTRPPPPPPGYNGNYADQNAVADDRYAADAERWARSNCVKSQGDTAGGALLGGIIGAIIGSSVAGRHDRGAGAFAGAAVGAVGGAAIASGSGGNETSPGCPPGYVARRGAVAYSYGGPGYAYAAPGWYRPWVFIGGAWSYRPYPYHDWYYRTYRHGDGDRYRGGRGYRGGEGWRDHGWGHRGY